MASLMSAVSREAFARRVRVEMAKAGVTRESLAERANVKERTLGNLLGGHAVRDQTVAKIAKALAIDLDELLAEPALPNARATSNEARADEAYGGYILAAYETYIGTYVAYRRSLSAGTSLYRSVFEIDWDDEQNRLRFFELQRFRGAGAKTVSSSHAGGLYISPHTGLIQMLTTYQGALRLVTLTRFRLGDNKLTGLILTQSDRGFYFQPAASAIYLERLEGRRPSAELEKLIGVVTDSDPAYGAASAELNRIECDAVVMAGARR